MNLPDSLHSYQIRIETVLDRFLPAANVEPQRLHEAMRYAVLNGGKRIRPLLVYATGEMFGVALQDLDYAASAVELIHCYSLIHDDLPAMDDDDVRRGKPTCHKAFDEATAILAGDALQSLAVSTLLQATNLNAEKRLQLLQVLAEACSSLGMVGGQALDLAANGKKLSFEAMRNLHQLKTGALIAASIKLGALIGNAKENQQIALENFAAAVGLAFQIQDDILDTESDTTQNKSTYPELLGITNAKNEVTNLYNIAINHLQLFNEKKQQLHLLANYIVNRNY